MNFRTGLILIGSLALGVTGCASGGGGGGGGAAPPAQPAPSAGAGEELEVGEAVRENDMTRAARSHLEAAAEAETEAEAEANYEQALQQASQAIQADPTNPLPWLQGGRAQIGLGQLQAADSMLTEAEELRPLYQLEIGPLREQAWIEAFNSRAQPLVQQGQYEEAAQVLEDADAIYEGRPEAKIVLGQIYLQLNRADEAVPLLREALEIVNSDRINEMDSATVAQWEEQQEDLPVAITDALMQSGQYEEATDQLKRLIEREPENLVYKRNLASIYMRREMPDSARGVYDDILQQPGLEGEDYFEVGVGLYNMDEFGQAADVFEQALERSEWDRDAAEMVARSLQLYRQDLPEGEDLSEAEIGRMTQAAERWLDLDPYNRNAHVIAAQAAVARDDQERAQELITDVEELPVATDEFQIRRGFGGGAVVSGSVENVSEEPGATVVLNFTFYGRDGQEIGTRSTSVTLPAPETKQVFQVELDSEEYVAGYTYEIEGLSS